MVVVRHTASNYPELILGLTVRLLEWGVATAQPIGILTLVNVDPTW